MSAMASLVDANYTDSEEDDNETSPSGSTRNIHQEDEPVPDQARAQTNNTPNSVTSKHSNDGSAKSTPSKALRLVSYAEDDIEDHANQMNTSTEEDNATMAAADSDKNVEPVEMDLDTEDDANSQHEDLSSATVAVSEAGSETTEKVEDRKDETNRKVSTTVEAWTEGVKLPPEPPGQCNPKLQESITSLYKRKISTGYDMNAVIQNKKAFRNPSIYEKLIQFCNIDEHGTNFPKDLYDGHLFGPESYYDELAKVQKADMEKREKAAKERSTKTAAKADKRPDDGSAGGLIKRRSKWDQVGPTAASVNPAISYSSQNPSHPTSILGISGQSGRPTLVAPTAASTGKSIPAFGTLKKH